jgi:PAS domain S-box-containing protein
VNRQIQVAGAVIILFLCLGAYAILLFAKAERQRDLQTLQTRMNIVAESRVEAVNDWLGARYEVLLGLARNESLQLYTRVLALSGTEVDEDPEQADYLRHLLNTTAERSGLLSERVLGPLPANVRPLGIAGLALLDPEGRPLVSTAGMPPIAGPLAEFVARTPPTGRGLLDLHPGPTDRPTLGFLVPVLGPDEEGTGSHVIARLLGVGPVDERFFTALIQPGATARTSESYLIRRTDGLVEYLTPLLDGSAPLSRRLALNTPDLVDAEALRDPGHFHQGLDYAARASFAVSRRIAGTDWVLVHRLGATEALAESEARLGLLLSLAALVGVVFVATLVLVWRFATSRRVEEAAHRYRRSSERFEALSCFLDIVTDSQPHPILVVDAKNQVTFANRRATEVAGLGAGEAVGRSLAGVLGHDRARVYEAIDRAVLDSGESRVELARFEDETGGEQVWRSYHRPFSTGEDGAPAVLITLEDLTDLVRERTRRERNTHRLIETLVGLVDERDPDSAHQSRHVAQVARTIAEDMGLDPSAVETVEQAARLVNIGKIRIPRSILTKDGALTEEESRLVRQALDDGPALLRDIEFDGPVLETLSQINECFDGSGRPLGLAGGEILITAQIVAIANAFVALISPRAFRDARSPDEASAMLMTEIGRRFDRRVVSCLLNHLDNRGGRESWAGMSSRLR